MSLWVNHRENDKAKGQSNAGMRDGSAANLINNDCASASEDQGESSKVFRKVFFPWFHIRLGEYGARLPGRQTPQGGQQPPERFSFLARAVSEAISWNSMQHWPRQVRSCLWKVDFAGANE